MRIWLLNRPKQRLWVGDGCRKIALIEHSYLTLGMKMCGEDQMGQWVKLGAEKSCWGISFPVLTMVGV